MGARGIPSFEGLERLEDRQMMVADPVTTSHPVWTAVYASNAITINGTLAPGEWDDAPAIVRASPSRPDQSVTMRVKYNEGGLMVAVDVRDQYLWADGSGGGTGSKWDWWDDDALAIYFDPSNTRKRLLTPAGRMLAFNLGKMTGAQTGPARITRYNFIAGNNDLVGQHITPYGDPAFPKMRWMVRLYGTLNRNTDLDQGWTGEVFLPWAALGMAGMPENGRAALMNFEALFDDDGGGRDTSPRDSSPDPAVRFGPSKMDDQINGVESSFNVSRPGMEGPVNYAQLVFSDPRAEDAPTEVYSLGVRQVTGYGAWLSFTAPFGSRNLLDKVGVAQRGAAAGYEVRWSDLPITGDDASFQTATPVVNTWSPKPPGRVELLRIGGLQPGQQYWFAVRAVDGAGRAGPITVATATTLTAGEDASSGTRVMTSPAGGILQMEDGQPFTMVGNYAVPNNLYMRNLYHGLVWNSASGSLHSYAVNPGGEGSADGYFQALSDAGVNTLWLPLEWLALPQSGRASLPDGMYWLEYPRGNYNPEMRDYLWRVMDLAHEHGIKLVLRPFNTFNYRTFFELTPWAAQNGGPLSDIDDFYQTPAVWTMATDRLKTIVGWANQHANPETVIGYELFNEWDDWTWTLSPRGDGDPARTLEFRDRAKVVSRIAAEMRAYDPSFLIVSSSIGLVPRGPTARALFIGDAFDVLAPHFYTNGVSEPVYNPAADRSVLPVSEYATLAGYWMTNRRDGRVLANGEWGLVKWKWPNSTAYYTGVSPWSDPQRPWTVQNDVDLYRTTSWAQIAMGMGGNGMRLAGTEMRDLIPDNIGPGTTGYLPTPLPRGMRDVQASVRNFVSDTFVGFDWTTFDAMPLAGRVRASSASGKALVAVGSTGGDQGLVYVLQDANRTTGTVADAALTLDGFGDGKAYTVEFWSTGADAGQVSFLSNVAAVAGKLTFALPSFGTDLMVRFRMVA